MVTEEILCVSKRFTLSFAKWHFFSFQEKAGFQKLKETQLTK